MQKNLIFVMVCNKYLRMSSNFLIPSINLLLLYATLGIKNSLSIFKLLGLIIKLLLISIHFYVEFNLNMLSLILRETIYDGIVCGFQFYLYHDITGYHHSPN